MRALTIAVDGPGSAGKGTVARAVARALDYRYVDTGAMYRAVALASIDRGVALTDAEAVSRVAADLELDFEWTGDDLRVLVGGVDVSRRIRTSEMGDAASLVSTHPPVRTALLGLQRALAARGGVVLDGRDIGTVVLPDADLKVFLDGSLSVRAARRHLELVEKGESITLEEVRAALAARDKQDSERAAAPLKAADDAVHVDTTHMTIAEAVESVLALVDAAWRAQTDVDAPRSPG